MSRNGGRGMKPRLVSWRLFGALALIFAISSLIWASAALASVTRYEETDPSVAYTGGWSLSSLPGHSSGSLEYSSDAPNATATFSFTGTGVDWIAAKWYNRGIAAVSLDGSSEQMVDLYAPGTPGDTNTVSYQQVVYSKRGLANGPHTLRIRVTGTFSSGSSPYLITVDAFDVFVRPPVSTPASSPWTLALLAVIGIGGIGVAVAATRRTPA